MPIATYQGVILAAGQGSRMGALGDHYPKALLPVANQSLLMRHLQSFQAMGVHEVFVVIGHHGAQIREAVRTTSPPDMTLHFIEQARREGLAHAVGALESQIRGPFILLLGDIYFEFGDLAQILAVAKKTKADAVLAVRDESDPDRVRRNFSVVMNNEGRVSRVVEKPVRPTSRCKGCGLYMFTPAIFDAIRRTPRSSLRQEFELTDAIQILVDDGSPVFGVPVVTWDVNVTTPEDLIACNTHVLQAMKVTQLTGENSTIAPGTVLESTVLGDDVHIRQPCVLRRCVVLSGTVIDSAQTGTDQVYYPNAPTT